LKTLLFKVTNGSSENVSLEKCVGIKLCWLTL